MHLRSRGVWKAESVLIHNQDTCSGIYELHKNKVWKHLNDSFWITRTTSEWFICEGKDIESSWLLFIAPAFHSNIPPEVGWRWYTSPYNRRMEHQTAPNLMYISRGVDIGQNICAFERQCLNMAKYQNVILHGGQGSRMVAIELIKTFLKADSVRIVAFVTATARQAMYEGNFLNKEFNLGVKATVLGEKSMSWERMDWEKCFAVYRVIVCHANIYRNLYRSCMTASQFSLIVLYECVETMGLLVKLMIQDCTTEEKPRIVALSSQLAHPNSHYTKRSKYESLLQAKIIVPERQKIYFPKTKKFVVGYPEKEPYEEIFHTVENILKQTLESVETGKPRLRQFLTRCFDVLSQVGLLGFEHFITQTVPPLLASYVEREEWAGITGRLISEIKAKIKKEPTDGSDQGVSSTGVVLSDHGISIKVAKLITLLKQLFWDSTETLTRGVILVEESDLSHPLVFLINTIIDGLVGLRITAGGCGDTAEERDTAFAKFESGTISVLVLTQDILLKLKGTNCSFLIQYSTMDLPKFLINQFAPRDQNVPSQIYVFEPGADPELDQCLSVGEHDDKPYDDQVVILGGCSKIEMQQSNRAFANCLDPSSECFVPKSFSPAVEPVLHFVSPSASTYAAQYPPPKSPPEEEVKTISMFNPYAEEFQPSSDILLEQNDVPPQSIFADHQFSYTPPSCRKPTKPEDLLSQFAHGIGANSAGSIDKPINEPVVFIPALRNKIWEPVHTQTTDMHQKKLEEKPLRDIAWESLSDTNMRMEKLYSDLTKPISTPKKDPKFQAPSRSESIWTDGSKSWSDMDNIFDRFSNDTFKPACNPIQGRSPKDKEKPNFVSASDLENITSKDWGASDTLWGHNKDLFKPKLPDRTNSRPESIDFFSLWTRGSERRRASTWSSKGLTNCDPMLKSTSFSRPPEVKADTDGALFGSSGQLLENSTKEHEQSNFLDRLGLRSEIPKSPFLNPQGSVNNTDNATVEDKKAEVFSFLSTAELQKNDENKDKKVRRRRRAKRRRVRKKKRSETVTPELPLKDSNAPLGQKSSTVSVFENAGNAADSVWNLWGKPQKLLSPNKNPSMKWSQLCHKDPKSKLNVLVLKMWRCTEVLRYTTRQNHDSMYITDLEVKPVNRIFTSNGWRTKKNSEQDASHQAYVFLEKTKNQRA